MRPPIPVEEHHEVLVSLQEMLPGLEKAVFDDLAADYLLEAVVCIDDYDLNYILIRPGPFVSGEVTATSAGDLTYAAERLMGELLDERATQQPPSGALIVVRAPKSLHFRQFSEIFLSLKAKLHEETECFSGYFIDPDATEAKIRICLSGAADFHSY